MAQIEPVSSPFNVSKVSSINLKNNNFYEFVKIKESVGNSRIVLLGEPSHFDATALQSKNKLIKYLHEEMGFDVLILENNIYTMNLMDRAIQQCSDIDSCIFLVNVSDNNTPQLLELYTYVREEKNAGRKLNLAGLDIGYTDGNMPDSIRAMVKKHLSGHPEQQKSILEVLDYFAGFDTLYMPEKDTAMHIKRIKEGHRILKEKFKKDKRESTQLLIQTLLILPVNLKMSFRNDNESDSPDYFKLRDEQMAKNAIFLIDKIYKGRKVIISTSTYHTFRNYSKIQKEALNWSFAKPMGQYLYERYKDTLYSIATIGYEGKTGLDYDDSLKGFFKTGNDILAKESGNTYIYSIYTKESNGIEHYIHSKGYEYAFVPFRNSASSKVIVDEFYMEPIPGGDFKNIEQRWSDVFDGIFYYRESIPIQCEDWFLYFKRKGWR